MPPAAGFAFAACGAGFVGLLDAAVRFRRGFSPLGQDPQAGVWATVLSMILWTGVEALNARRPAWGYVGLPGDEFARYAALGALFSGYIPGLIATAALLGARRPEPTGCGRGRGLLAALGLAAAAATVGLGSGLGSAVDLLIACLGLLAFFDGLNAAAGRPALGVRGASTRGWAAVLGGGVVRVLFDEAAGQATGARRLPTAPPEQEWAVAACALVLGPLLLAAYYWLADAAGFPPMEMEKSRNETNRGVLF